MAKTKYAPFIVADLQAFAEGAASGTGEGGQTGETGTAAVSQSGEGNPAAEGNNARSQEDIAKSFDEMINGEYKDAFDNRVQTILKGRLAETKDAAKRLEKITPMIESLAERYGVKADDLEGIMKAVEEDDDWLEEEALRQNKTVEELKAKRKADREIGQLRKQIDQLNVQRAFEELRAQEKEVRKIYPDFDAQKELKNPLFETLLRSPLVDMKTAYEIVHKDETLRKAVEQAERNTEKRVTDSIMANGMRPQENGNASQGASSTKSDVSKLTAAQRQEMIARAARGERIVL